MSGCNNCFNGCDDIVSDQCVKYTGIDIPEFDISKGDTLYKVEYTILSALIGLIKGNLTVPEINEEDLCVFVKAALPPRDATLNQIIDAIFMTICSLKETTDILSTKIDVLEEDYSLSCLPSSTDKTSTHAVLQATVNMTCSTSEKLTALDLNVKTNYVRIDKINEYIAQYISTSGVSSLVSNKMVPYAVLEYYGPLTNFDASGAGIGDWKKVYLCNGSNGTPDKRGRVAVGVTVGMLGGAFDPVVDPAVPGNPNYTIGAGTGSNTVVLEVSQIPSHSHSGTTNTTGVHNHPNSTQNPVNGSGGVYNYDSVGDKERYGLMPTTDSGSHSHTLNIDPTGGGLPHTNVQPGIGCYYIQYRP